MKLGQLLRQLDKFEKQGKKAKFRAAGKKCCVCRQRKPNVEDEWVKLAKEKK